MKIVGCLPWIPWADSLLFCYKIQSVQCWKQKCAAVLLEHGADPNIRDSRGNCSLHYAVYNGHEDMAALLLEYHADIEQKTKVQFTTF